MARPDHDVCARSHLREVDPDWLGCRVGAEEVDELAVEHTARTDQDRRQTGRERERQNAAPMQAHGCSLDNLVPAPGLLVTRDELVQSALERIDHVGTSVKELRSAARAALSVAPTVPSRIPSASAIVR